jgi:hypothetical protein
MRIEIDETKGTGAASHQSLLLLYIAESGRSAPAAGSVAK